MFRVFSEAECAQIAASGPFDEQLEYCKNIVRDFLTTKDVTVTNPSEAFQVIVTTKITKGAKVWHHDDVTIVNFITNIRGEGTSILMEDGGVCVLPVGHGCVLVGDQGYTMLGLKPTLHRGPPVDIDRCLVKVAIPAKARITDCLSGPSVCDTCTNVELYKERCTHLDGLLRADKLLVV